MAIRLLKRYVADQVGLGAADGEHLSVPDIADRAEQVAVVGAGLAGLTAAYFLRLKGYRVTVFEASDQAGGMMRTRIQAYLLPRDILAHGIDLILNAPWEKI